MVRFPLKMKFPNSENLWLRLYTLNRFFLNLRGNKAADKDEEADKQTQTERCYRVIFSLINVRNKK